MEQKSTLRPSSAPRKRTTSETARGRAAIKACLTIRSLPARCSSSQHAQPHRARSSSAVAERHGPVAPAGGAMGDIHATFVPAAQPDIIRAAEKDEFYRKVRPHCAAQALRPCAC